MDIETCIAELRALAPEPDSLDASDVQSMLSDVLDSYRATLDKDETAEAIRTLHNAFVRFEKTWDDTSPDVRDAMLWAAGISAESRSAMLAESDRSIDQLAQLIDRGQAYFRSADSVVEVDVPLGVAVLVAQALPFWVEKADPELTEPNRALHALEVIARFVDDSIDYGSLVEAFNSHLAQQGQKPFE